MLHSQAVTLLIYRFRRGKEAGGNKEIQNLLADFGDPGWDTKAASLLPA
jgi:hypothetical protein